MKYLVLDFETTGLEATEHEPTQVAALLLDDDLRELATFATLIKPERPERVQAKALEIQGRTLADFTHAMDARRALGLLADTVGTLSESPVVVGHNIPFDLKFLRAAEERLGIRIPRDESFIDTLEIARLHLQARNLTTDARLETLTAHYGIPHTAHDALGDVRATAQLLIRFLTEVPEWVDRSRSGTFVSALLADARVGRADNPFLASVASQFETRGFLTMKQLLAVGRMVLGIPGTGKRAP